MLTVLFLRFVLQLPATGCDDAAAEALARARELRQNAGVSAAAELLKTADRVSDCHPLSVAERAATGWLEARAVASAAGAEEVLGPARAAVQALAALASRSTWRVQNEYARAAITAAIAAAQDERPEMSVYLVHARSLSERLLLAGEHAEWPLPIDELEGELWLEVDRYTEARDAYQRAVETAPSASALTGLGRVHDRLDDHRAACDAFRRALTTATGSLAEEARTYLARPSCQPG